MPVDVRHQVPDLLPGGDVRRVQTRIGDRLPQAFQLLLERSWLSGIGWSASGSNSSGSSGPGSRPNFSRNARRLPSNACCNIRPSAVSGSQSIAQPPPGSRRRCGYRGSPDRSVTIRTCSSRSRSSRASRCSAARTRRRASRCRGVRFFGIATPSTTQWRESNLGTVAPVRAIASAGPAPALADLGMRVVGGSRSHNSPCRGDWVRAAMLETRVRAPSQPGPWP
jgi:hypothetical protein